MKLFKKLTEAKDVKIPTNVRSKANAELSKLPSYFPTLTGALSEIDRVLHHFKLQTKPEHVSGGNEGKQNFDLQFFDETLKMWVPVGNALLVFTWHEMGGPQKKFEIVTYVS